MTKDARGVWSVTVGPLQPELWDYTFRVNGIRTLDPANSRVKRNATPFDNSVLIPGAESSLYEVNNVPHGTLSAVWYPSPTLKLTRRMRVYTPPGYESGRSRYPVLYLFHGAGGDEEEWTLMGRAAQILDNLIAAGKAKPMIVVMPNGHASQTATRDVIPPAPTAGPSRGGAPGQPGGDATYGLFPDSIINDVIPFVDKTYRVAQGRENRAVAGVSMGGAQSVYTGLRNLDRFAWVAGFGGAYVLWPGAMVQAQVAPGAAAGRGPGVGQRLNIRAVDEIFSKLDAKANSQLRLFYMSCGTEDGLVTAGRQLKEWLKSKGIQFVDVETPGYAHVWSYWRKSLADLVRRLFQPKGSEVR